MLHTSGECQLRSVISAGEKASAYESIGVALGVRSYKAMISVCEKPSTSVFRVFKYGPVQSVISDSEKASTSVSIGLLLVVLRYKSMISVSGKAYAYGLRLSYLSYEA